MSTPEACTNCSAPGARVTPYWDREQRLCGRCCQITADHLDAHQRWPDVPWWDTPDEPPIDD